MTGRHMAQPIEDPTPTPIIRGTSIRVNSTPAPEWMPGDTPDNPQHDHTRINGIVPLPGIQDTRTPIPVTHAPSDEQMNPRSDTGEQDTGFTNTRRHDARRMPLHLPGSPGQHHPADKRTIHRHPHHQREDDGPHQRHHANPDTGPGRT